MAISELAWLSLVTAREHLRLALDAIKAMQLYPRRISRCCSSTDKPPSLLARHPPARERVV
jgi:hypothetical protein